MEPFFTIFVDEMSTSLLRRPAWFLARRRLYDINRGKPLRTIPILGQPRLVWRSVTAKVRRAQDGPLLLNAALLPSLNRYWAASEVQCGVRVRGL
jgi:hypothetical protein